MLSICVKKCLFFVQNIYSFLKSPFSHRVLRVPNALSKKRKGPSSRRKNALLSQARARGKTRRRKQRGGTRSTLSSSRHVAHVFWKKSHGTRERNLVIDRNERESILYSTVQRRTGAIYPRRSQGAPSRNAIFTEKVRERRKQRDRKTKHISRDGNPPFFDFAKQESSDDLSQRTREKNPKFTMDVRRRFTRFYFRKPIAFGTRLFYAVF